MTDRAQLEATLNGRGVPFDYYADDATLEEMVAATGHLEYSPVPVERDRAQLEQYLQARGVTYADDASDEQLRAAVEATIDAEHARYLERYQPVITRLPGAIGTSPELPEPEPAPPLARPHGH